MVTQAEALNNYSQTQADIETIKVCVKNLERIIELKLSETKRDIAENRQLIHQHNEQCEKHKINFEHRLVIQEQFSTKVFYFYSAVTLLMGIIIGAAWKPF